MTFPIYDFSNPSLNYSLVEATTKEMYKYIIHTTNCCMSDSLSLKLSQVDPILTCLELDKNSNDTLRYKDDVKSAYLLLYPLT